jgi:hypothetical protein
MSLEFGLLLAGLAVIAALVAHARWSLPQIQLAPEVVDIGLVATELSHPATDPGHVPSQQPTPPPLPEHDILDDYEAELDFMALTPEGSAEHRLALLEALLLEADDETSRMELLVNELGQRLAMVA